MTKKPDNGICFLHSLCPLNQEPWISQFKSTLVWRLQILSHSKYRYRQLFKIYVGQHHQLGNWKNKVQKFCLKSKKESQIRIEELRRRKLLKGGNFLTHKQIFMLIQRIRKEFSSCVVSTFCSVCTESCNLGPCPCLGESATHSGQVFFFFFFFDILILFVCRCVRSMVFIHKVQTFESGWLLLSST